MKTHRTASFKHRSLCLKLAITFTDAFKNLISRRGWEVSILCISLCLFLMYQIFHDRDWNKKGLTTQYRGEGNCLAHSQPGLIVKTLWSAKERFLSMEPRQSGMWPHKRNSKNLWKQRLGHFLWEIRNGINKIIPLLVLPMNLTLGCRRNQENLQIRQTRENRGGQAQPFMKVHFLALFQSQISKIRSFR